MKRLALVVVASVLLLAACGGGGGGGGGDNPTGEVRTTYATFFAANTPLADRVALLENGPKFKPVIQGLLSNPQASGISASVISVELQGASKAKVVYSINIAGASLIAQTGYAVLQGGKWKVADRTFCGLVALAGSRPAVCLQ